jgi:hypothetical protein
MIQRSTVVGYLQALVGWAKELGQHATAQRSPFFIGRHSSLVVSVFFMERLECLTHEKAARHEAERPT